MKTTKDFKVGDMVMYIPNGLMFRCENMKMWRWMQESGNYVKVIEEAEKPSSNR
jgi:hypothetical protein